MEIYIALLRGINVSGKNKIKMIDLKAVFESMGFLNVQTYLQSGNVIFETNKVSVQILEKEIETKILQHMGLMVSVIVRSKTEMIQISTNNPFLTAFSENVPDRLYVTFLSEAPSVTAVSKLDGIRSGEDQFIQVAKEIYVYCPGGYGRTKLTNNLFEAKLKLRATSRSWRTVIELNKMI